MIDHLIKFSLKNRLLVVSLAALLLSYGGWTISNLPIDVFPDLNRPTVNVIVETGGLAPEEAEILVTYPIELALNGTPGLIRMRSATIVGVVSIFLEFEWGTDIYRNRQLISERLNLVRSKLPPGNDPVIGPISSVMGDIQMVAITSENGQTSPMDLRTIADWEVKNQLLSIPGISQVVAMGGEEKQYQVMLSAEAMRRYNLNIDTVHKHLKNLSESTSGGIFKFADKEFIVRNMGRVRSVSDIENSMVGMNLGIPIRVKDIAKVQIGAKVKRGEGSVNAKPAVLLTIKKQPGTSTIDLTREIEKTIRRIQGTLPKDIKIHTNIFNQADFIQRAINNIEEALRDGAILVAIVLFLFLVNFRTTFITLTAIPLSFAITAIIFKFFDLSINTMTLGGLAIAIGELVDDAIVDVENVYRRLKENARKPNPIPSLQVVFNASKEIRNSIVFATIIVILVFIPLFAMGGIEGRFFIPLGIAYIVSILASLFVSLTVTPVLCSYLLPNKLSAKTKKDGILVVILKSCNRWLLKKTIDKPYIAIPIVFLGLVISLSQVTKFGLEFLPEFNEGTAMVVIKLPPGVSLEYSNEFATAAEEIVLEVPEVESVSRRTGRGELDEFLEGVHHSEIFVKLKESDRSRSEILNDIRTRVNSDLEGAIVSLNQPISERLDFMTSGVKAQIAIKIFGPDVKKLRAMSAEIYDAIFEIEGLVDLQIEQQVPIPQLKIRVLKEDSMKSQIAGGELVHLLNMALEGETPCVVLEGEKTFDVFTRLNEKSRSSLESIQNIPIAALPGGRLIALKDVADVYESQGPNIINRENARRRVIVQANASGRDLNSIIKEIRSRISDKIALESGYSIEYDGQFKNQQSASRAIMILGIISIICILLVLYMQFKSWFIAFQIIFNIPMALIGSVVAIYLSDKTISIASMVAFVTLCGISTRNGILMISHYLHIMKNEKEEFSKDVIIRGSLERLVPVLMTSVTACLALLPLVLAHGEPGKEILHPVAVVILGGLISSTALDLWVTPTVFYNFGKKAAEKSQTRSQKLLELR